MAYGQAAMKYGLSVEMGTDRVPHDGKCHLLVDGEIVLPAPVEALALAEMEEVKTASQVQGRELLQREQAAFDGHAFCAANYGPSRIPGDHAIVLGRVVVVFRSL